MSPSDLWGNADILKKSPMAAQQKTRNNCWVNQTRRFHFRWFQWIFTTVMNDMMDMMDDKHHAFGRRKTQIRPTALGSAPAATYPE